MTHAEMTTVELLRAIAEDYDCGECEPGRPCARRRKAAALRARADRLEAAIKSVHGAWDTSDENVARGYLLQRLNAPDVPTPSTEEPPR